MRSRPRNPLDAIAPPGEREAAPRPDALAGAQTVSAVVLAIERTLFQNLGELAVEGEVSSLRHWRNGNWYFDLKDARSTLPCVMRSQHNSRLDFELKDGQRVVAHGRVGLYRQHCKNQLVIRRIEPVGQGRLLEALERLKKRLFDEGLFEPERKKPLPQLPQRVGVVTSPQGAVLHDVIKVIRGRTHGVSILLSPTRVQGEGASKDIAAALERLDRSGLCDVIIVGRGGGSLEDLMPFNMEAVVRAIAAANTPVISSVGHETDTTFADLAADVRAATPSHAAELAVAHRAELERTLHALLARMQGAVRSKHHRAAISLHSLVRGLGDPRLSLYRARDELETTSRRLTFLIEEDLAQGERRLAHLTARLEAAAPARTLKRRRADLSRLSHSLSAKSPAVRLATSRARVEQLAGRLHQAERRRLETARHRLGTVVGELEALSPLAVLHRGYTLVKGADGEVISRAHDVNAGDSLDIRFADGEVSVKALSTRTKE